MSEYLPTSDEFVIHTEAVEAERAALGCILLDPMEAESNLPKIPAHFFNDLRHQEIRWGLEQLVLDAKPPDIILLCQVLRNHEKLTKAGGIEYLSTLQETVPTALNLPHYISILKKKSDIRLICKLSDHLRELATSGQLDKSSVEDARYSVEQLLNRADSNQRVKLTLRRPSEILAMKFADTDGILGGRFFCKGQSLVVAGQAGIGKSRLLLQMLASIIAQRPCIGWDTGNSNLRWLILQSENTNRRVQEDLNRIKSWLTDEQHERFDQQVLIHTLENDSDGFVSLDLPENRAAVSDAVEDARPDIICLDPLNEFGIGDLNKDADMRETLQTASKILRKGNHERAIIISHHALTGKQGAAKAVGYDRSSFARNSKALLAWTRAQINLAAVDEDSNDRVIVACGKSSNAREFKPFAVRLHPDTMIYEMDDSVDVKAWQDSMSGKETPMMTPEGVRSLCKPLTEKTELARLISQKVGCAKTNAYRYIRKAEIKKTISISDHDLCSPK